MRLEEDLDFSGKIVLVTGAANGFGEAIARAFSERNASLVLADIEAEPLSRLAAELGAKSFVFDQSNTSSVEKLALLAGAVDVLINNAGVLVSKPLLDTSVEEIRLMMDTDFVGVLRLMQCCGRGMVERRSGVILSIGSQTAFCGGENRGVYAAAKAAVSQLTRAAAVEWGPFGVRVVCLAPGRSATRMTAGTARSDYSGDRGLARVPLGRWGTPEEVAKMVVFLTSEASAYVTGETIIADGGYVLG